MAVVDDGSPRRKPIEYAMNGDCWECISHSRNIDGYINIRKDGKVMKLHRVIYQMHNGNIPEGMVVMHSCDNRACINPAHLLVGTINDNTQDMLSKGRGRLGSGDNRRSGKYPAEVIQSIRGSEGTHKEVATRFGVSWQHVANIRAGNRRRNS